MARHLLNALRTVAVFALVCLAAVPGPTFGLAGGGTASGTLFCPGGGSGGTVGSLPIVAGPGSLGGVALPIAEVVPPGSVYVFAPPAGTNPAYYYWSVDGTIVAGGVIDASHPTVEVSAPLIQSLDCSSLQLTFITKEGVVVAFLDLTLLAD